MRLAGASLMIAAVAVTGCLSDSATLTLAGEGGGERAVDVTCDGEGGVASLVFALAARARSGVATYIVRDGMGAQVHERHVAAGSGSVSEETAVSGAPGAWTLEERRTDDFHGELDAALTCG